MINRRQLCKISLPRRPIYLLAVHNHGLCLILILIDAHSGLKSHLDLAIVDLLLVLLTRSHVIHIECDVIFHLVALLLNVYFFKLGLFVVMNS